jgi:hypothetical protein
MIDILVFLVSFLVCFIISSLVHEMGHILTGLLQGFKFHVLVAGPLGLKRDQNDRIVLYLEKDASLWGGLGATIPTTEHEDNYKKFGRILLGGPVASIIFGAIWLPLGIIQENVFFLLLGAMPMSMGIVSLIPMRNGAFYTDGGRWLRMYKNEKTKAVEVAVWNLTQQAIIQGSFEKANRNAIMILINDEDIRTKYIGHYYAFCHYRDTKDVQNMEQEKAELEKLKGKVPNQMVSMFDVDQ